MKKREQGIILKKNFTVKVLSEFASAMLNSHRISSNIKIQLMYYLAINGRSHFWLRNPRKRSKPIEEEKEVLASNHELDIKNAELNNEINILSEKINEYKILYLENLKYKEKIEDLIEKGVLNSNEEFIIKF